MANSEDLQQNISSLNTVLKQYKSQVTELHCQKAVTDWLKVDLKKYHLILQAFHLVPEDLATMRTACQKQPKILLQKIDKALNLVGDMKADMLGHYDVEELKRKCETLTKKQQQLEEEVHDLLQLGQTLSKNRKQLIEKIKISRLIKISQFYATKKKQAYLKGIKLFELFFPEAFKKKEAGSFEEYKNQGAALENRFKALDVSTFPNLAEEVLTKQIMTCLVTSSQITTFLGAVEGRFHNESLHFNRIKETIKQLREEDDLSSFLTRLIKLAQELCQLIIGVAAKYGIYEHLILTPQIFERLNIYHLSFKNNLLPTLTTDCKTINSPVNPKTVAFKSTKKFFSGLKGMVRSFKLMYASVKGKGAFNEEELQDILQRAINECRIFYGNSKKDLHKLKSFIDHLLVDYARPFPYNQLFFLTKQALAEYGTGVEEYIAKQTIDGKYRSLAECHIPSNHGKLMDAIVKDKEHITKLVNGLI